MRLLLLCGSTCRDIDFHPPNQVGQRGKRARPGQAVDRHDRGHGSTIAQVDFEGSHVHARVFDKRMSAQAATAGYRGDAFGPDVIVVLQHVNLTDLNQFHSLFRRA